MFDNIAPKYDFLNRLLSGGIDTQWRRKAIRHMLQADPQKVLDIATGTGDMAILTARFSPKTQVTGLDLSNEMLEVARNKVAKRSLGSQIDFLHGDSENLPYDDNSYDAITVAFGVRNFENTLEGLKECYRVLKPGGEITILEFSQPTMAPFKQLYFGYFKYILPLVGRVTSGDPKAYTYLFESAQAFPARTGFIRILKDAGFSSTFHKSLTFGICALYSAKK
ncbi:UNVERIFIED_CONTAM: hypothetical protein GTU68_028323 [Idotea baltica]|nr:hypothetical protein [Idotea baltica]